MLSLDKICQPGERVTIVTKTTIVVATAVDVGSEGEFWKSPGVIQNSIVDGDWFICKEPKDRTEELQLRTRGTSGCAVGLKVESVRDRGHDH